MVGALDSEHRRHDSAAAGFTLSEVLVVLALLGLVLAAAWSGMLVINRSAAVNERNASAAKDLSEPLEQISKALMQNNMISSSDIKGSNPTGADTISVWTNPTLGAHPELDTFMTVPGGDDGQYQLLWRRWVTTSDMKTIESSNTWVMSYSNANKTVNVPMFTYYDASGTVLTAAENIPSSTRYVVVRIVAALPGGSTVEASRTVYFRNRN